MPTDPAPLATEAMASPVESTGSSAAATSDSVDLPPPGTTRWVIRRKAAVVAGVHQGRITLEEACQRYQLPVEEFLSWQGQIERHWLLGLRATRVQDYRREPGPNSGRDQNSGANPG